MDELTLTLHHPLTDKEWDDITDVDFEHTNEITFYTKNGKEVVFVKKTQWIPNTKETMPKDPRRKQIQLKNGWIITGWFDGEDWLPVPEVGASLLFDNVLAWCELPSPYQPEE